MAVIQMSGPSDAALQRSVHNRNIGGGWNVREQFTVPPDTAWAVVGLVLADAATPASIVSTLIPAIEALIEVTSVNGNQVYGQVPATIEDSGSEAVLYVSTILQSVRGAGADTFGVIERTTEKQPVPEGKKWVVLIMRLPAELDNTSIGTLETALQGITGVTLAEHLVDGYVSDRAFVSATLTVAVHLRIDTIEV